MQTRRHHDIADADCSQRKSISIQSDTQHSAVLNGENLGHNDESMFRNFRLHHPVGLRSREFRRLGLIKQDMDSQD